LRKADARNAAGRDTASPWRPAKHGIQKTHAMRVNNSVLARKVGPARRSQAPECERERRPGARPPEKRRYGQDPQCARVAENTSTEILKPCSRDRDRPDASVQMSHSHHRQKGTAPQEWWSSRPELTARHRDAEGATVDDGGIMSANVFHMSGVPPYQLIPRTRNITGLTKKATAKRRLPAPNTPPHPNPIPTSTPPLPPQPPTILPPHHHHYSPHHHPHTKPHHPPPHPPTPPPPRTLDREKPRSPRPRDERKGGDDR